jgi:integrase
MPRRPQGSVVLRAGVRYARITLHREPPQHGRSPRAEVRIVRPEGAVTDSYALAFARRTQALYDAGRWAPDRPDAAPAPGITVAAWVARWCAAQDYTTAEGDAARVARYLDGTRLGSLEVRAVTPRDVAGWITEARTRRTRYGTPPAERTVRNAYDVLRRALSRAVFDGLLSADPCAVIPSELTPGAEDAHPERRRGYRLARADAEQLLSDPGVEDDRAVLYHLLLLTGARLGEAAGLRWCDISPREPLAAVILAEQVDGRTGARRATKTRTVREVPLHPVLATVLAWWREGWSSWYGREPGALDLIVPARRHRAVPSLGSARRQSAVWRELQRDLEGAGLPVHRVHDLRHTFASLCADAGMAESIAARWTHAAGGGSAREAYVAPAWSRQCAEMLRLTVRSGLAERATGERRGERCTPPATQSAAPQGVGVVLGEGFEPGNGVAGRCAPSPRAGGATPCDVGRRRYG